VSRHLAIDWDHQSLRIVAATLRAGGIHIEKAACWQESQIPNIAEAEALGHHLRERLKAAGIAPAPVLACVARDRVILRDVRYPAVAAGEEPAVIRFQVMKELNDSPDEVIIDYTLLGEAAPGEEHRALVLTVRRELLSAYQTLCKSAGLKLLALTPRPFGTLACLRDSRKKRQESGVSAGLPAGGSRQAAVALLTSADDWSEFCLVRDDTILVARSLPAGPALAAEVRRNIAVYTAQSPRHTVSALYLAGNGESSALQEELHTALGIPVRTFDPFLDAEEAVLPAENRGAFAGAVGLLRAQAGGQPLPINFVSPKKPQAARDPNKRTLAIVAGVAACLLIGLVSYCYARLAALDSKLETKKLERETLEKMKPQLVQKQQRLDAYDVWRRGNINWLDELYNLTVLMPDHTQMLLSEFTGDAITFNGKDKPAKITLKGGARSATGVEVARLLDQMRTDKPHYDLQPKQPLPHRNQKDFPGFAMLFSDDINVEWQPPEKYTRRLSAALEIRAVHERAPIARHFQEIATVMRPISSGGIKRVAEWEQGKNVINHTQSAAPNYNQRRATSPRSYPGGNTVTPPSSPSGFQKFMREQAEQRLEAFRALQGIETPLNTTEKPARLATPAAPQPTAAAAAAPAAPAAQEKGRKQ
jgi:Tfp pilus assembly PilM family ATPase